jgi:regulator of nucleoside diphosphate kinase
MQKTTDIIISETDLSRLEKLLTTLPVTSPVREALQQELDRADVVPSATMPANVVTMNSTVKFALNDTDESFSLTLVYPKDMQENGQTISILAPAGSAMLGVQEGDSIAWPSANGKELKVKVMAVTYQPERAGELHR